MIEKSFPIFYAKSGDFTQRVTTLYNDQTSFKKVKNQTITILSPTPFMLKQS